MFFQGEWLLHPLRSLSDNADGGILVATLEHWFRIFRGEPTAWRTPEWLWPTHDTLANTDSYFLDSLPYSLARAAGLDQVARSNKEPEQHQADWTESG